MAKQQRTYTPEFRQQMVELVRVGRKYDDLAQEFGCSSWSTGNGSSGRTGMQAGATAA